MRQYAKDIEVDEFVQWTGYVDEADKPSLYRLADVFVFPSEYEGFGLPPLEAMASGTPVVASDAVVMDEVLEDGAYLVNNPRSMAGAIIALLIQPPFHEAMINQGLAQATKYSWRKTAKKTLEVYEKDDLIGNARRLGPVIALLTKDFEQKRTAIVSDLFKHLNGKLTDARWNVGNYAVQRRQLRRLLTLAHLAAQHGLLLVGAHL